MEEINIGDAPAAGPKQHRTSQFFHVFFKGLALFTYLFNTWFTDNFVLVFVFCVLLLAFDFWTVQNVTGRLLVGLRWKNQVTEDGGSKWVFESKPDDVPLHPTDSLIFWTGLYVTPLIWAIFGIGALSSLRFQWLLIVLVALILGGANMYGYYKCHGDAKRKIQSWIANRL